MPPPAFTLLSSLRVHPAWQVGCDAWLTQHARLQALARQAHAEACALPPEASSSAPPGEDSVAGALIAAPAAALQALVAELLTVELWREQLLPGLLAAMCVGGDAAAAAHPDAWLRLYFGLYSEGALANAMQTLLFHEGVVEVRGGRREGHT